MESKVEWWFCECVLPLVTLFFITVLWRFMIVQSACLACQYTVSSLMHYNRLV